MDSKYKSLPQLSSIDVTLEESDELPVNSDVHMIMKILSKLSIAEQVRLLRGFRELPDICSTLWHQQHKHLDLRTVEDELQGSTLDYFLQTMQQHFRYVHFSWERLQQQLNLLEHAGLKQLTTVQACEIAIELGPRVQHPPDWPQWPLHALPKLFRNLRRLKVACPVHVRFIEQFTRLEYLTLNDEISSSALNAIIEGGQQLKRLHLPAANIGSGNISVTGISNCARLIDLALPAGAFIHSSLEVLSLPRLRLLELRQTQDPRLSVKAINKVIEQRAQEIEVFQLNCRWFQDAHWLPKLQLQRCERLCGLVLVDCQLWNVEMCKLALPQVTDFAVFCQCSDLKDYQLLDFIKNSPKLMELYLIDCPMLTYNLLRDIYKIRRASNLDYTLRLNVENSSSLMREYNRMYKEYWNYKQVFLKVKSFEQQDRLITDIQFFFHQPAEAASATDT